MRKLTHISENLRQKLNTYKNYPYTIVNAPDGYGKTSVLKEYFKHVNADVFWIKCEYEPNFFFDVFKEVLFRASTNKLPLDIAFPMSVPDAYMVADWVSQLEFKRNTVFIFDDYTGAQANYVEYVFKILSTAENAPYRFIFVYNQNLPDIVKKTIKRDDILLIDREDLRLRTPDIMELCSRNGFKISEQQAWEVYDYCEGWPIIVDMQLRQYERCNNFDIHGKVTAFLHDEVLMKLDEEDRDFLTLVSAFETVMYMQTQYWVEHDRKHNVIEKLERIPYIRYDSEHRLYKLNRLVQQFFAELFEQLSLEKRKYIYSTASGVFKDSGEIFKAMRCLDKIGDYDSINAMDVDFSGIFSFVIKKHKPLFINVAHYYLNEDHHENYKLQIILVMVMFLLNEVDIYTDLAERISNNLGLDDMISDDEKKNYLAELGYIRGIITPDANDGVNEFYKVRETVSGSLSFVVGKAPLLFGAPSAMMIYHRTADFADMELKIYEGFALEHSRMTNGHGKGIEELFRAELLFNRGDVDEAIVSAHEAMRVSRSRNQNSIYLASLLLQARTAIFHGNTAALEEWLQEMGRDFIGREKRIASYGKTIDICKSFLFVSIDDDDRIPEWLKDENVLEDETNCLELALCNVIYGKHLLNSGQYRHIRGVCGHMLGIARSYSFILPMIYIYIYMSISEYKTGDVKHASIYLNNALEKAHKDMIYMPFVENYEELMTVVNETVISPAYNGFIRSVEKLYRTYVVGRNRIIREKRSRDNYGLTARELDVARLAARRMSNREIASQLTIAESTVKSNMKTIFAKLDISSRSQLSDIFK